MNLYFFISTFLLLMLTAESICVLVTCNGKPRLFKLTNGSTIRLLNDLAGQVFGVEGPITLRLKRGGRIVQPRERARHGALLELIPPESIEVLVINTSNGQQCPFHLPEGCEVSYLETLVREALDVKGSVTLRNRQRIMQRWERVRNGEVLELILPKHIIVHVTYERWRLPFFLFEDCLDMAYLEKLLRKPFRIHGPIILKQDGRKLKRFETVQNGAELKLVLEKVAVVYKGQRQLFVLRGGKTSKLNRNALQRFGLEGPAHLIHDGRILEDNERVPVGAELKLILPYDLSVEHGNEMDHHDANLGLIPHSTVVVLYDGMQHSLHLPMFSDVQDLEKLVRERFCLEGPVRLMQNGEELKFMETVPDGAELNLTTNIKVTVTYNQQQYTFFLPPAHCKATLLKKLLREKLRLQGSLSLKKENGAIVKRSERILDGAELKLELAKQKSYPNRKKPV